MSFPGKLPVQWLLGVHMSLLYCPQQLRDWKLMPYPSWALPPYILSWKSELEGWVGWWCLLERKGHMESKLLGCQGECIFLQGEHRAAERIETWDRWGWRPVRKPEEGRGFHSYFHSVLCFLSSHPCERICCGISVLPLKPLYAGLSYSCSKNFHSDRHFNLSKPEPRNVVNFLTQPHIRTRHPLFCYLWWKILDLFNRIHCGCLSKLSLSQVQPAWVATCWSGEAPPGLALSRQGRAKKDVGLALSRQERAEKDVPAFQLAPAFQLFWGFWLPVFLSCCPFAPSPAFLTLCCLSPFDPHSTFTCALLLNSSFFDL